MKISLFGQSYVGCNSAACLAIDSYKLLRVGSSYTEVDQVNQGNSLAVVTENSLKYANVVLQRIRPNQKVTDLVRHWADKDVLVGERYYAIID